MPIVALILTISAAIAPNPTAEYAPAAEEAYTLDLEVDGYRNGAMDPDRLMEYRGCVLERDAAYMYALLMEAAEDDGVSLGFVDCYRSYGSQANAYNSRCPIVDTPIMTVDPATGAAVQTGVTSARVCSGPPTARPGASNHGWGRAVDFSDGNGTLGCSDETFRWMQGNAHRFGWVHPDWAHCGKATQEPWHWEYAGVTDSIQPGAGESRLDPKLLQVVQ